MLVDQKKHSYISTYNTIVLTEMLLSSPSSHICRSITSGVLAQRLLVSNPWLFCHLSVWEKQALIWVQIGFNRVTRNSKYPHQWVQNWRGGCVSEWPKIVKFWIVSRWSLMSEALTTVQIPTDFAFAIQRQIWQQFQIMEISVLASDEYFETQHLGQECWERVTIMCVNR